MTTENNKLTPDLTYLQLKNHHPRDDRILFDEPTHTYTIDGDSNYKSVTTWNHSHFSAFDADAVIRNIRKGKNWGPNNKYYGMTDDEIMVNRHVF